MKKEFLEGGRVCTAHGVRGVLKIESWCDSPRVLSGMKRVFLLGKSGVYEERKVLTASAAGEFVLMSIDGVASREAAQAMRGVVLYLKREDIPVKPGAVFLADMIGLPLVEFDTGRVLGEITEVTEGVQGKLYTVKTERGEVIFPGIPEFVKEIDAERGVFVRIIPGFFD